MLAITIAFPAKGTSAALCIYSGPDAAAAIAAASAYRGGHRCEVFVNPQARKKVYGIPQAPASDPSDPSDPSDQPDLIQYRRRSPAGIPKSI